MNRLSLSQTFIFLLSLGPGLSLLQPGLDPSLYPLPGLQFLSGPLLLPLLGLLLPHLLLPLQLMHIPVQQTHNQSPLELCTYIQSAPILLNKILVSYFSFLSIFSPLLSSLSLSAPVSPDSPPTTPSPSSIASSPSPISNSLGIIS